MSNPNELISFSEAHYRLIFKDEGGVTEKALERCAFAAMQIVGFKIDEIAGAKSTDLQSEYDLIETMAPLMMSNIIAFPSIPSYGQH